MERHSSAGQGDGGGVAVVVDSVVEDTGQSARALVFGLHGAAPDREDWVVAGEVVLLDVGRYGVGRPRRNEYAPNHARYGNLPTAAGAIPCLVFQTSDMINEP